MRKQSKTFKKCLFFLTIPIFFNWLNNSHQLFAQYFSETASDSLDDVWSEETYFQIEMLRLERWIKQNILKLSDPVLLKEVVRLKKEAENFAEADDFFMANIWLETLWDLLLHEDDKSLSEFFNDDLESLIADENNGLYEPEKKFHWSKEVTTGVDLWRQQFNFTFFQGDSTFLEGDGNPFTGVRLSFDYGENNLNNTFQGHTFFRYSRDYVTGEANLRLLRPLGNNSHWKVENRFEGTTFFREFDLKYWQNVFSIGVNQRRLGPLSFEIQDELVLRHYATEDGSYPNYYSNRFNAYAKINIATGSSFGLNFNNTQRLHPTFKLNDYHDNRLEVSWWQTVGGHLTLSFQNEIRYRNYTNAPVDTVFQDYLENDFLGEIRLAFSRHVGTEFKTSIIKRDYDLVSLKSLPDFLYWEIEPSFYLNLGSKWRLSAGLHYGKQSHQQLVNRLDINAFDATFSIAFEDFSTIGPVIEIEFFEINGLLFSLRESFLLRRYPNSPTDDVDDFNLYSDRNINSVLLFLTWNISPRWTFNLLANVDDDRSRKSDSGDSQNTIVGLEVGYSF